MLEYRNHQLDRQYRLRKAGRILFRQVFATLAGCALVFALINLWFGSAFIETLWKIIFPEERQSWFGSTYMVRPWGKLIVFCVFTLAALILIQIILGMLTASMAGLRKKRAALVLSHLTTAVQLRLPIPQYLRAAARGESLSVRRRAVRLAKAIESGQPLAPALQSTNVEIGSRSIALIDAGERSGSLTETLTRLSDDKEASEHAVSQLATTVGYTIAFTTVFLIITLAYSLHVVPKFYEIHRGFGIQMDLRYLPEQLPLIAVLIAVPLLLIVIVLTARNSRGVLTSGPGLNLFKWLIDPIMWRLPVIGRIQRSNNYRDVADIIAMAAARGYPLDVAIRNAMMPHLNRVMLHRLGLLQQAVAQGVPAASAAHHAKLPEVFISTFSAPADFAGTMRYVSQLYATQHNRAMVWINAVLPIISTTIFAVIVGWLGMMLFGPMVSIIDAAIARISNP